MSRPSGNPMCSKSEIVISLVTRRKFYLGTAPPPIMSALAQGTLAYVTGADTAPQTPTVGRWLGLHRRADTLLLTAFEVPRSDLILLLLQLTVGHRGP